jgi:uncharacterized protein involved in response to NO
MPPTPGCRWGSLLLALAQMGWVGVSAGVHALAVGATGGLIIGMVTRTARGHTGRPLRASKAEVLAYALVMAAATLRVVLPILAPQWFVQVTCWQLRWPGVPRLSIYLVMYMHRGLGALSTRPRRQGRLRATP